MSGNSSKIIAFNYFGGKFTFLDELYQYFPVDFIHLVDLFAGSFVVSLNYNRNVIKTANEINQEVTNFFEVLRNNRDELIYLLKLTPCSDLEYRRCWDISGDPVERARRFYVRVRQSYHGFGIQRKNKGWQMAKSQLNCAGGETVSKWNNAIPKLDEVAFKIAENFQITSDSYEKCIKRIDFKKAFFYCDPPYPYRCRKSQKDYRFEFTDQDHIELADRLNRIKGMAMISSYDNELYDELYTQTGWTKVKLTAKENNLRPGQIRETIWFNYPIEQSRSGQNSLFK